VTEPVQLGWKRPILIGVGWGLGTAVGLVVLVGGFFWYEARPQPPKPGNPAAIKAEYDMADTEGDDNNIVVYYTLENTTDFDYRAEKSDDIKFNAKLQRENSLSPSGDLGRIEYPIMMPAKKRVRFPIHLSYPYPGEPRPRRWTEV
jgi:hypothetical protein